MTDENGRLVGIISRADVLSVFDRTDAAIDQRDHPRRAPRRVHGGPAGLPGDREGRHRDPGRRPETNEAGHQIVSRVRHVPGVVAVRDRLNYPPAERLRSNRYDVLANFPMD